MRYAEIAEAELAHTEKDDRELDALMRSSFATVQAQRRETTTIGHIGEIELRRTSYPYGFKVYFVVEGEPVGFAHVQDKGSGEYVSLIWLRPAYRRRGVGTAFYRLLAAQGVSLRPDKDQTAAGKALWNKLGR